MRQKEGPCHGQKCRGCGNPATKFCEATNGPYEQPMTKHGAFSMSVGCGYPICDDCEHVGEDKHQHKLPFVCADCGHQQDSMGRKCDSCDSVRVVALFVVMDAFGENWRKCFEPEDASDGLLVWWTDQQQAEVAAQMLKRTSLVAKYIREQFSSRMGRNGRARLWSHPHLPKHKGIFPWPDNDLAKALADDRTGSGGVVILKTDHVYVHNLPGLITDMQLRPVRFNISAKSCTEVIQ